MKTQINSKLNDISLYQYAIDRKTQGFNFYKIAKELDISLSYLYKIIQKHNNKNKKHDQAELFRFSTIINGKKIKKMNDIDMLEIENSYDKKTIVTQIAWLQNKEYKFFVYRENSYLAVPIKMCGLVLENGLLQISCNSLISNSGKTIYLSKEHGDMRLFLDSFIKKFNVELKIKPVKRSFINQLLTTAKFLE